MVFSMTKCDIWDSVHTTPEGECRYIRQFKNACVAKHLALLIYVTTGSHCDHGILF